MNQEQFFKSIRPFLTTYKEAAIEKVQKEKDHETYLFGKLCYNLKGKLTNKEVDALAGIDRISIDRRIQKYLDMDAQKDG